MIVSRLIKERKGHYERLIKDYKKQEMYVNTGLLIVIIIIITNIYYNLIYDKLSLDMKKKTKQLYNATIAGIIAVIIAWFAYIDAILPVFFLIFIIHYYFSMNE